jgi:hypothetical protein
MYVSSLDDAIKHTKKFWEVLKARRAKGLGDKFWASPGPVFRPQCEVLYIGLIDDNGKLSYIAEKILSYDDWSDALAFAEPFYRSIVEAQNKRAQQFLEKRLEEKRVFAPLQVIPYAMWKWPWLYIAKIYYQKPEINYVPLRDPYVVFPRVFKDTQNYDPKWQILIKSGWINEIGEVRDEIVAALKERERRLLDAGGILDDKPAVVL